LRSAETATATATATAMSMNNDSSSSSVVMKKYIALTFDDGPHQILTPKLLDIGKAKGARFTFYMMGIKADVHPDIVKRAVDEGHEVANHAWDHPILSKIPLDEVSKQLRRTNDVLKNATNSTSTPLTMRPPYGNTNKRLNNHIMSNENLSVVMWSYDALDWKRPGHGVLLTRITTNVKAGDVILCHDIHPGTIQAVPYIIDAMQAKGYTFETVSTMILLENSIINNKKKASSSSSSTRRSLRGSS
jgi:peptidoglycan/xylan/chitin deacetylase (PgdA/CDA1 family)